MARKPPKLKHVKHVRDKKTGKVYPYFNTGQKNAEGRAIYTPLPQRSAANFFDVYYALCASRTKRAKVGYTVSALVDDYLASARFASLAENTRSSYVTQSEKVKDVWGHYPASRLESQYVREIIEGGKWGGGTSNMVLAFIGTVYTWGRRNKGLTINPTRDVDRFEGDPYEPWPEDVLEAALASDDPQLRLAVHLLYFTGQRIGDVLKMRWGDIRDGFVYVRQQKTGKVVEPPLISDLRDELDRTPKTGLTIIHGIKRTTLGARIKAFLRKHGQGDKVPHGLRKNAVIAFLEAGCTVPETAAITGQTHQVVEHYAAQVNRRKLGKAAVVKFEAARAENKKQTGKNAGKKVS